MDRHDAGSVQDAVDAEEAAVVARYLATRTAFEPCWGIGQPQGGRAAPDPGPRQPGTRSSPGRHR